MIGVDIGGTKVAAGLVDQAGQIAMQVRMRMLPAGDAAAGLGAVTAAIDATFRKAQLDTTAGEPILGIGICAPGPLDPTNGIVVNPPNVPCWRNYPLAREVANLYRIPVKLDNDANAAALAEARWGAGQGYGYVFYATIGTGIGTGVVLDGRIYHGRTGAAAEGGHVSIDYRGPQCACGKHGCIERLAAGPAIAERARATIAAEPSRAAGILDLAGGRADAVSSKHVGRAYSAGDALAAEILGETVDLLSIWLGNIIDLLDPDVIVVGGGVSAMLAPFFGRIKDQLPKWCVNSRCQEVPLLMARYGADAGIAGGAALCYKLIQPGPQ